MIKKPDFTLVLACYNEGEHFKESVPKIVKTLNISNYSYELIFIDDKSKDNTPKLIRDFVKTNKNSKAYYHKRNVGRGGTVSEGILYARSKIVGFIDIDLEVSPMYIPYFVNTIMNKEADVVIAHRFYPSYFFPINSFIRMMLSIGYVKLGRIFLDLPVKDTEAGYKFFDKEKIVPVLQNTTNKHWFWDTEIVARSMLSGLKVNYIPTLFLKKTDKTSTVKLIPDTIHFIKSILKFRKTIASEKISPPGLIYRSTKVYEFVIKQLFGNDYSKRYKAIADLVKNNTDLLDVCCGDAKLYEYLKNKNVTYTGVDISLRFVKNLLSRGCQAIYADVSVDSLPIRETVVMQGSLYQFKNPEKLIEKLYRAAKKQLIISESIHNLAQTKSLDNKFVNYISTKLVGTNHDDQKFRYDEIAFKSLLKKYKPKFVKISGQRDLIAVINK